MAMPLREMSSRNSVEVLREVLFEIRWFLASKWCTGTTTSYRACHSVTYCMPKCCVHVISSSHRHALFNVSIVEMYFLILILSHLIAYMIRVILSYLLSNLLSPLFGCGRWQLLDIQPAARPKCHRSGNEETKMPLLQKSHLQRKKPHSQFSLL
jgi:hypothetical protein